PFSARGLMVTLLGTAEPTTLRTWFAALSEGGEVLDDLQRRPWGASDGRVRDRYGVEWLIGYEHGSDPSGRAAGSEARGPSPGSVRAVVRGLHDRGHVVRVGLLEPGRGDAHELPLLLELGHGARPDVEHRLVQAAGELVDDGAELPLVGDPALDALRHDL